jgi:hypothetical protein
MRDLSRTINYGGVHVPVLVRQWKRRKEMTPYYRTDFLKPGQRWSEMPTVGNYTEHYVQLSDGPIPVGALIARELRDEGAIVAVMTDLTMGRLVLVDPDLFCVAPSPPLSDLLETLRIANAGVWAGLPDAIALFSDGRVAMREAKVAKKDRLNKPQQAFAQAARSVLGEKLDLAVVEWGYEVADS